MLFEFTFELLFLIKKFTFELLIYLSEDYQLFLLPINKEFLNYPNNIFKRKSGPLQKKNPAHFKKKNPALQKKAFRLRATPKAG